jgi:hypothetical protein
MEEGADLHLSGNAQENAAPLERGRNVAVLERALADDSDEDLRERSEWCSITSVSFVLRTRGF